MITSLAALEFGRVLQLVAFFARTERGRKAVLATLPRFETEGERAVSSRVVEAWRLIEAVGPLPLTGLDAVDVLDETTSSLLDGRRLADLVVLVRRIVEVRGVLVAHRDVGAWIADVAQQLPQLSPLLAFCDSRLGPDGEVLDTASQALAHARTARERQRAAIVRALDQVARQVKGVSGPLTVRRERYCLPVPMTERQRFPGLVLDVSGTGATVYVEPLAVVELNNALAESTARAREEEERVLAELAASFARHRGQLLDAAAALTEIDALQARVLFGKGCGANVIVPVAAEELHLHGARHPLLEPRLAKLRDAVLGEAGNLGSVTPLDIDLDRHTRVMLLSGPNAGGKTVALKTIGLTVVMAYAGIPVLADEGSVVPRLRSVWCRIGDDQSLLSDRSTFSAAMTATASLLADLDDATLVLYDELGSGTDPEEGAALAAALLEELVRRGCWAVATAHLVTVAAHLEQLPGAANAAMGFDEDSGRPTYRLSVGAPGRSRGLAIARHCGVQPAVVDRASQLVSQSFLAIDTYLSRLDDERRRLLEERSALRDAERAAWLAREAADDERARAADDRRRASQQLADERERLRQKAIRQLNEALEELQRAREQGEMPGKKKLARVRHAALDLEDPVPVGPVGEAIDVGTSVRLAGTRSTGVVSRVVGDRVEVVVAGKRLWLDRSACQMVASADDHGPAVSASTPETDTTTRELRLLGLTQEEAREEIERFLDRAMLAGVTAVRIVHGHGSGALRRVVREIVKDHPAVVRSGHPPQQRGGTGVTEVELE